MYIARSTDVNRISELEHDKRMLEAALEDEILRCREEAQERSDAEQTAAKYEGLCVWLALAAAGLLVAFVTKVWA